MKQIKSFIIGVKNLIKWAPVVWSLRDWDYRYALDVFSFQLNNIADYLESEKSFTTCANTNAQKIRTATKLMKKVYEEEYAMEYLHKVEEKFGNGVMSMRFENIESSYLKELRWEYEYWDNTDEIESWLEVERAQSQTKQLKAERILWEFLKHNIGRWWD